MCFPGQEIKTFTLPVLDSFNLHRLIQGVSKYLFDPITQAIRHSLLYFYIVKCLIKTLGSRKHAFAQIYAVLIASGN